MKTAFKFFIPIFVFVLLISCGTNPQPPKAEKILSEIVLHGDTLLDNYHWLKDKTRQNKKVIDYIEAENDYTKNMMKHTRKLQEKIYHEIVDRIDENDVSVPVKMNGYYYYNRKEKGKQYSVYCRKKGKLNTPEEIYLDENELAKNHSFYSIFEMEISPDQNLLAYSADTTGMESYTLFIKNLKTNKNLPETFYNVGDVTWANDSKTFFYTTEDESGRDFQVYRHTLGNDPKNDKLLYTEKDEAFYVWLSKTKSKKYILLGTDSKTTSEIRFLKATEPFGKFRLIQPREHGLLYYVQERENKFFIKTNADGAKNFKIMTTSVNYPAKKYWKTYLPYRDSVHLAFTVFKNYLVMYERFDGIDHLRIRSFLNGDDFYVDFSEPIYSYYTSGNPNFDTEVLRYSYESPITPFSVYDFNMKTKTKILRKSKKVKNYNPNDYESKRVFATAKDGVKIPISLVYKKSLFRKDGSNFLKLDAYGAYGDTNDPYFSVSRLSLLNRGFVYATAHVRGGGELGKKWYEQGKMFHKKNTFTDFIACAEYLISQKYTTKDKLVIEGGSAGGLLIGAVLNMRPDLFKVVVADVPFVDIINTELDSTLSASVTEYEEWGNPYIKKQFDYMFSYSPYDNVKRQNYPAMLVLAGFHDKRVNYWEPAKWVAKLRDMKTDSNVLLLKTDMSSGHSGASGRFDFFRDIAFEYAFILDELGIEK